MSHETRAQRSPAAAPARATGEESAAPGAGVSTVPAAYWNHYLQRMGGGGVGGIQPNAEAAVARASGAGGSPLPATLQRKFERSLGADLGGVRVHTGAASAEAAESVSARAYTVGSDIHFGAGQYNPSSSAGEALLAHEVAHTVQQAGGAARKAQYKLDVSSPGDALEVEADAAAESMVAGRAAEVSSGGGLSRKLMRDVNVNMGRSLLQGEVNLRPSVEFWYLGRNIATNPQWDGDGTEVKVIRIPERHGGVLRIRCPGRYAGEPGLLSAFPPLIEFSLQQEWTIRPDATGAYRFETPVRQREVPEGPLTINFDEHHSDPGAERRPSAWITVAIGSSANRQGPSATGGIGGGGSPTAGVNTGNTTRANQGGAERTFRVEFAVPPRLPQPAQQPAQPPAQANANANANAAANATATATAVVQGPAAIDIPIPIQLHFRYGETRSDDRSRIERWAVQLTPDQRAAIASGRLICMVDGHASTGTHARGRDPQDVNRRVARSRANWVGGVLREIGLPVRLFSFGSAGSPGEDFLPDHGVENLMEQRVDVIVAESHVQR